MEQLIRVQLEQNKYQVAPDWREVAELVQELHWLERERTDTPTNGRGRLRHGASVLAQAVTHARQTSLVTSHDITKPARQLGRARQRAARRSDERAVGRPRRATGVSRTVGGVTTLGRGRARARGHEHAASGATERGRRCSERNSLRAPAPRPPRSPHRPRLALAPKRRIYLPCTLALLPEDVAQGAGASSAENFTYRL
ncbi:unnamed protein product [Danaus chrysippus]|uniref:(African queen) hypothetical protein n=1 Tax=Danaus chrysippus TaxID=151541 RepID=A0A8J2R8P9_9NEOP|nr:unnamed protein product [Danaus chrysippus]